jgi:hypothetical protein
MRKNYASTITRTSDSVKKTIPTTIVTLNRTFSAPRLVVYTALSPPNPAPSPDPLCCSSTAKIITIARAICVISKANSIV